MTDHARRGRPCRRAIRLAAATVLLAAACGVPGADARVRPGATTGGAVYVERPEISRVACLRRCAPRRRARRGSVLRIRGTGLSGVRRLTFHGRRGTGDDVRTRVRVLGPTQVRARVPAGAISGPVSVEDAAGIRSRPTRTLRLLPAPPAADPAPAGLGHRFPIRGEHDYGGTEAGFGAARAGHRHRGQDVFAACETALVAARGGRVKASAYQSAAGNYVVIDGARTGVDYVYMHLAEPSPLDVGDRVRTGGRIGAVGETGRASGCHLHFELWSAPGWYEGGSPFDPLASLRAWELGG